MCNEHSESASTSEYLILEYQGLLKLILIGRIVKLFSNKPQNKQFLTWVHRIFRTAVAPDFVVESSRGAFGHSRSHTRWSQARLSFLENLCIKKHIRLRASSCIDTFYFLQLLRNSLNIKGFSQISKNLSLFPIEKKR